MKTSDRLQSCGSPRVGRREAVLAMFSGGSKSRNKVSVGEPAEGSLTISIAWSVQGLVPLWTVCAFGVVSGIARRSGRRRTGDPVPRRRDVSSGPEGGGADRVRSGLFLVVTTAWNGLQVCRLDTWHGESSCRTIVVKRQLSTVDLLARASMKNAANCDT